MDDTQQQSEGKKPKQPQSVRSEPTEASGNASSSVSYTVASPSRTSSAC